MKVVAVLLVASLPVPQISSPLRNNQPVPHLAQQVAPTPRKGGKWFFARTGHAVYCYGPVMTVPSSDGEIERVATFCRGDKLIVPLKD
jgi:hypothetical protein